MWAEVGKLRAHHGEVPLEFQILKITEEAGEAAEALIGMAGMNSRKGVCRTREDLLAELADVIITAAVAMASAAGSAEAARAQFEQRLAIVVDRAGVA